MRIFGGSGEQGHNFVPWQGIDALSIERHASGNGMIKTVVIGIKGQSSFWDPAVESRFMRRLLQPIQSDGYRRLPLGNMAQTHSHPTDKPYWSELLAEGKGVAVKQRLEEAG